VRIAQVIAAAGVMLACAFAPAHAEKRVALVVGNAAYDHADKLANPVNDAQGVRDALKKLGFDVIYGENLKLKELQRAIGQFAGRVDGADVALVYFAGHGATFGDTPYVVPVDAEFSSLSGVPYELVPLEKLIGELRRAKGVRIAILDACRDDAAEQGLKRQAASRGGDVTRGLGPMKNPSGLIIAYATQYMSTAADDAAGAGPDGPLAAASVRHSPFTAALLNNIATPGLDVKEMFDKVGSEVEAATGGRQRPEISISLYGRYVLAPAANPGAASPPGGSAPASGVAQAWGVIQNTTSLAVLDDFIRQFGNTPIYGSLARARRVELAKQLGGEPAKQQAKDLVKPPAREPAKEPAQESAKPATGPHTALVTPPAPPAVPAEDPCRGPVTVSAAARCAPLTAAQERGLKPKDRFQECENCPEMVVVPAGSFTMGSPDDEKGRYGWEGPQHDVKIGKLFAAGRQHVTVDQFAAFVRETKHEAGSKCQTFDGATWEVRPNRSWRNPGFVQEGSHPVVCVSWDDAKAYVDWLVQKTARPYRLLSEAEWEYAARARTSPGAYPRFWFGDDEKELCRHGNGADQKARESIGGAKGWTAAPCSDGFAYTSPAGHYLPNAFGLHDMFGNAWQWTSDCWHDNYDGAPADGSAWTTGSCGDGAVVRGGSWGSLPRVLRAANRIWDSGASSDTGFRLARAPSP
jgi:formylglycine-generating enzyme required for sulfatase activity